MNYLLRGKFENDILGIEKNIFMKILCDKDSKNKVIS